MNKYIALKKAHSDNCKGKKGAAEREKKAVKAYVDNAVKTGAHTKAEAEKIAKGVTSTCSNAVTGTRKRTTRRKATSKPRTTRRR